MANNVYESQLEYLEDELEWVETRCKRIITEKLVREMSTEDEDGVYYNQSYYGHHNHTLEALTARRDNLQKKERKLRMTIDSRLALNHESGPSIALDELCKLYSLDNFERNVLILAASTAFSRRFVQLYGRLWDGYEAFNVETVFSFCELSFAERITKLSAFGRDGNLFQHELVQLNMGSRIYSPKDLLDAQITISNRTFDFMLGAQQLMDEFMDFSSVEEARAEFDQVVLDERDKVRIRSVVQRHDKYLAARKDWGFDNIIKYGKGMLMLFYGKPGTGKTMMAHAVANEMNMRVLNVDIPTFINHYDAQRFLPALFREAKMQNAVLFFDECEALFATRAHGNPLMTLLLTEIERFEGVAILATNLPQQLDDALDRRILVRVNFPEPDRLARREIWEKHLPDAAPVADDVDLDALAEQFEITGGYIKNAVLMAVAEAVHSGGDKPMITMRALEQAAREQATPSGQSESPVSPGESTLDDLVLQAAVRAQLDEVVAASRSRKSVLDRNDYGHLANFASSVVALFHGPSGTGKTTAAHGLASALNRPLRFVSAAGVSDDWSGTRHHLTMAFTDATTHNAVLVIDDVDGMYAGGEYAKWLRSELERHDGVVILTAQIAPPESHPLSNVSYSVEFAAPDAAQRAELWTKFLGDSVDAKSLAERELTGGQIRNQAIAAAFRAAQSGEAAVEVDL